MSNSLLDQDLKLRDPPPKVLSFKELLDDDPTQTQQQLAKALNMSQETISRRLRATEKINKLAKPVKDTLKSLGWAILLHPLYFPDLTPSEYRLFTSMRHALAEQHFSNFEEVGKRLDEWFAAKDKQFSGLAFMNYLEDGRNV
ncbi:mariner Mos1 transposase [Trichonephila clavipes]|nr:mariner Mos1 transposase [Trichonephila clavipes]